MQLKSAAILSTLATPLPFLIATNTTGVSREPAVEEIGRQNHEFQCYNSDLTAFLNGIATRILNGAPVQFKPIPMNVAATGTLLPNSSFPKHARV